MASDSAPNKTLRVGLAQCQPGGDQQKNLSLIAGFVERAASEVCDVVVFPEYSHIFSPENPSRYASAAEELGGEFVTELTRLSTTHGGIRIVVGMVERSGGESVKPFNTVVAVGPDGLISSARKIHLFDAFGFEESAVLQTSPGPDGAVWSEGEWCAGMLTCYDLRFPEVTRYLADQGATVVIIPAQWLPGNGKLDHWRTLLRARAIENQTWVVAVGHPEPSGVGHSMVIDPFGQVVLELGADDDFASAELTLDRIDEVRQANPVRTARRFRIEWSG